MRRADWEDQEKEGRGRRRRQDSIDHAPVGRANPVPTRYASRNFCRRPPVLSPPVTCSPAGRSQESRFARPRIRTYGLRVVNRGNPAPHRSRLAQPNGSQRLILASHLRLSSLCHCPLETPIILRAASTWECGPDGASQTAPIADSRAVAGLLASASA